MPASTFTFFQDFKEQLAKGVHAFGTHSFKIALTNTAPASTETGLAGITQIAASGGYTAGGYALSGVAVSETGGTATVTHTDHVITASGGSIGPFRYIVYYNDTATSPADALIGSLDYGSSLTLADTEALTVDIGASGIFTLT